jgi:TrmH family RNA methyltransferase
MQRDPSNSQPREVAVRSENDLFQVLLALKTNRRKRGELGEIFVESVAAIKLAASHDYRFLRFVYADYSGLSDWAKGLIAQHPAAQRVSMDKALMDKISDREEASELIVTVEKREASLVDIAVDPSAILLILDRPSNHGNLGSILRSANAFGVRAVITTGHAVDAYDPAVIRASLGAVFSTPLIHEESSQALEEWLSALKANCPGFTVAGTDSNSDSSLAEAGLRAPLAIMMGNEAKGLSVRLKAYVDKMVCIPMVGEVDSLNLACATSIFLHAVSTASRGDQHGSN